MIEDDLDLLHRVLRATITAGRLPREALTQIDVEGIPPSLAVRDRLKEAQADQILVRNGAMSPQTLSLRHGLDAEKEQRLLGGS